MSAAATNPCRCDVPLRDGDGCAKCGRLVNPKTPPKKPPPSEMELQRRRKIAQYQRRYRQRRRQVA